MHAPIAGSTMPTAAGSDGLSLAAADEARRKAGGRRDAGRRSRSPRSCPIQVLVRALRRARRRTRTAGDNHRGVAGAQPRRAVAGGRRRRRAAGARSDPQRAVDADGAGRADRKRHRGRRPRHLHGRRPRAADGRRRRCDRNLLGPLDHDAPARQPRPQRRPPGAGQGRDRLGRGAAGVPEGRLRRRVDVRAGGRRRAAAGARARRQGARAVRVAAAHRRRDAGIDET